MTEVRRERARPSQATARGGERVNGADVGPGANDLRTPDDHALRDFYAVHAAHRSELEASVHALAAAKPDLAFVAQRSAAERQAHEHLLDEHLRRAIEDGAWAEHDRQLHAFGVRHAQLGVRLEVWHEVAQLGRELYTRWIFAAYLREPERALAALLAMQSWLDRAGGVVMRAYLEGKDEEGRRIAVESRMKSEFLANMSHELRTPLNAIMGFTELLHDGLVGDVNATQQEFLGDILASGRHLLRLVNEVLDLAKIEAGRIQLHPDDIQLGALVAEVRAVLSTIAAKKRIAVEVDIDPVIGDLHLDPAKLKQLLYNYLSNALKFTPECGRVVVRVRPEGAERLCIEVEDSGIGIDEADLDRLFVEFQQLEDGSRGHVGTGLGLALTRRLVEAQGGSVGVKSQRGHGSTFHAILPRRLPAVAEATRAPSDASGMLAPADDAPRVLVVEGDIREREQLVQTLSDAGYAVEAVTTGLEAIERLDERGFDAVALEVSLPDMSALEVLKKIRHGKLNRPTPVIITTVGALVSGLALHDLIVKPLTGDKLAASLESAGITPGSSASVLALDHDAREAANRLGLRARAANSVADALAIASQDWPRALVLDVADHADGVALASALRADGRAMPAVIWTASTLSDEHLGQLRNAAGALGANAPPLAAVVASARASKIEECP